VAINTSVEPFIQRMLMPPDPKTGAEVASGTINNFLGAYQARKDVERDEAEKRKNDPNYVPQGGFQRFARGVLGAPGAIEEGKQPFSVQNRALAERNVTLSRQIDSLMKDPLAIAKEIGDLTPDQIPEWIQKNAGLAANPLGKAMLDSAGKAYSSTKQAQIQAGRARHLGELAERYPNVDLNTPEGLAQAQKNESVRELYNRAYREGRTLNSLPDDWFNPDGTINEQKAVPGLGGMPPSERLSISRQELELRKNAAILRGDEQELRAIDLQIKALERGYKIDNIPQRTPSAPQPSGSQSTPVTPPPSGRSGFEPMAPMVVPPQADALSPSTVSPPRPTFTPVERPLTPAVVGQLQKEDIAADSALAQLNNLEEVIRRNPDAFGVVGIGQEVLEVIKGQLNPSSDPRISNARQQAGLAFVEMADSLRTDTGNMSRYEQERLKELGDTRSWRDFPERALGKAGAIKKMVIGKKLRILKRLKAQPDDQLLRSINSLGDIAGLVSSGLIDRKTAERWHALKQADKANRK
jgi:hypothetical protein